MGMFSTNRTSLGPDIDVPANESYIGIAGAYRAMCESYQNSYTMFEQCIGLDFLEAAVVNEGYSSSEFEVIQENFVTDLFNKCKEVILKLIEKIKGIVKSFIDRVIGTFTKDGKELVRKYKDQILKKDLKDMKYKYAKPTGNKIQPHLAENKYKSLIGDEIVNKLDDLKDKMTKDDFISMYKGDGAGISYHRQKSAYITKTNKSDSELDDMNEKIGDNTYVEYALSASLGKPDGRVEMSEYSKDAKEYMFEDEESETDGADKLISTLMITLQSASQDEKTIRDNEKKVIKPLNDMVKELERVNRDVINDLPDKDEDKNIANKAINKYLNTLIRAYNQMSTVVTKCFAVEMEMHKFNFAQTKRIWVQMAAYRPTKESVDLLEAIGEAAEYDAYSSFTEAEME